MKALLLKVINGIYNGGLVEYRADNVKKKTKHTYAVFQSEKNM